MIYLIHMATNLTETVETTKKLHFSFEKYIYIYTIVQYIILIPIKHSQIGVFQQNRVTRDLVGQNSIDIRNQNDKIRVEECPSCVT